MTTKDSLSAFQGFVIEALKVLVGWYAVGCLRLCGARDSIWGWVGPVLIQGWGLRKGLPLPSSAVSANYRFEGCQQCLSTEDHFGPQGTVAMSGDILVITTGNVLLALNEWRPQLPLNSAKQHAMHRIGSTPKSYPASNVNSVQV